jgi:hypothetical protein
VKDSVDSRLRGNDSKPFNSSMAIYQLTCHEHASATTHKPFPQALKLSCYPLKSPCHSRAGGNPLFGAKQIQQFKEKCK